MEVDSNLKLLCSHLIGHQVAVRVSDGTEYTGILHEHTFTWEGIELTLLMSRVKDDVLAYPEEKKIFATQFREISASNVGTQLHKGENTFKTDEEISMDSSVANGSNERTLQKWSEEWGVLGEDEISLEDQDQSGAWDQFAVNEKLFGLTTTYEEDYERLYTTPLDKNSAFYKEREAKARHLANVIQRLPTRNAHRREEREDITSVSDGVSEEDRYSAVIRDTQNTATPSTNTPSNSTGKYVIPTRRNANPSPDSTKNTSKNTTTTTAASTTATTTTKPPPTGSWAPMEDNNESASSLDKTAYPTLADAMAQTRIKSNKSTQPTTSKPPSSTTTTVTKSNTPSTSTTTNDSNTSQKSSTTTTSSGTTTSTLNPNAKEFQPGSFFIATLTSQLQLQSSQPIQIPPQPHPYPHVVGTHQLHTYSPYSPDVIHSSPDKKFPPGGTSPPTWHAGYTTKPIGIQPYVHPSYQSGYYTHHRASPPSTMAYNPYSTSPTYYGYTYQGNQGPVYYHTQSPRYGGRGGYGYTEQGEEDGEEAKGVNVEG